VRVGAFHASMPGYYATRLVELPELAAELGVGAVLVKDESDRLGLPAFKILGASWAVNCALSRRGGFDTPATGLPKLRERVGNAAITLVTATDGNHGRAVARMAQLLGLAARVYVPAGTTAKTLKAIADEGAQVVQTDLRYDDVVRAAANSTTNRPADILIQDTAWRGYEEIPQWIVDGYATLFDEIDAQLGERAVDLIAVPTGVGSLLQAALQHYRATGSSLTCGLSLSKPASSPFDQFRTQQRLPAVLAVEPVTAACVTASLAAGKPISVDTSWPTSMAGLNCGTVSTIAWPAIRDTLAAAVVVTDDQARVAMQRLHELGVPAGPSAAASLAGVRAALGDTSQRDALATTADSIVVLISTEGAV
jgi:diaminopropionate ammonia-lyase